MKPFILEDHAHLWKDMPEQEKQTLRQCIMAAKEGDAFSLALLRHAYEDGTTEETAARLFYGLTLEDHLAQLIVGGYFLHGNGAYPHYLPWGVELLEQAIYSRDPDIAKAAAIELAISGAPLNQMKLGGFYLEKYNGENSEIVVVPSMVRHISSSAFAGHKEIKKVILPSCLVEIGYKAFAGCTDLETIVFPNSLRKIDSLAFSGCEKLTDIVLPEKLQFIGNSAFEKCKALTNIRIPGTVSTVSFSAFSNSGLKEVSIGYGVKTVDRYAFYNCPLEKVTWTETTTLVEKDSFYGCPPIQTVTYIGNGSYPPALPHVEIKRGNDSLSKKWEVFYAIDLENSSWTGWVAGMEDFEAEDILKGKYVAPKTDLLEKLPGLTDEKIQTGYFVEIPPGYSGPLIFFG